MERMGRKARREVNKCLAEEYHAAGKKGQNSDRKWSLSLFSEPFSVGQEFPVAAASGSRPAVAMCAPGRPAPA